MAKQTTVYDYTDKEIETGFHKQIINLTQHPIKDLMSGKTYEPSGTIARVHYEAKQIDDVDGAPIFEMVYGKIYNLPEPKKGVYYLVSSVVLNALAAHGSDRRDCIAPYRTVRGKNGEALACRGFRING